jgi:hypothetical protein
MVVKIPHGRPGETSPYGTFVDDIGGNYATDNDGPALP